MSRSWVPLLMQAVYEGISSAERRCSCVFPNRNTNERALIATRRRCGRLGYTGGEMGSGRSASRC